MVDLPPGVLPVRDLTTLDVLYGSRETSFRYELLEHGADGRDRLAGVLDGVAKGSLRWQSNARVKKSGSLQVLDLSVAKAGMVRLGDVDHVTVRVRPVMVIEGLPEIPLGSYLLSAAPEKWADTHREFPLELLDRSTVLDQDLTEGTFTAPTGVPVLAIVQTLISSAGEHIDVDLSEELALSSPLVWEAGTPKLTIVNDLLSSIGYNSLWVDGLGRFQATAYERPAVRSVRYSMLNDATGAAIVRELSDGDRSIYSPDWSRDRDFFDVPNKVIAVAEGDGDEPPLSGIATNEDPTSPFSYPARGRWIAHTLDGVDVPDYSTEVDPAAATVAFLEGKARQSLIGKSAVQAAVSVKCLPIPVELTDVVMFASVPAGIDARHTVSSVSWELSFDGLTSLELREVIDL